MLDGIWDKAEDSKEILNDTNKENTEYSSLKKNWNQAMEARGKKEKEKPPYWISFNLCS